MNLNYIESKKIESGYRQIYETPFTGVRVAKTKHGYYPVTRDGQLVKKRRYAGNINNCEVWEHAKQKRVSVVLRGIYD